MIAAPNVVTPIRARRHARPEPEADTAVLPRLPPAAALPPEPITEPTVIGPQAPRHGSAPAAHRARTPEPARGPGVVRPLLSALLPALLLALLVGAVASADLAAYLGAAIGVGGAAAGLRKAVRA